MSNSSWTIGNSVKKLSGLPRERRRIVMFLSPENYRYALRDPDLLDAIDNTEVAVLSMDDLSDEDQVASRLCRSNKARAGALLVQSPYDADHYEPADAALAEFAVAKFMLLSRLCGLLGARSVNVEQVRTTHNSSKSNAKVNSKAGVHSSQIEVDHAFDRKLNQRLKLTDTFPGSTPDLDAARTLLARAGLEDDTTLASLVEMRGELNPLSKRQISLNLTQEAQGNLQLAGQYSGLKLVNVGATFSRQVNEETQVILTATIDFK